MSQERVAPQVARLAHLLAVDPALLADLADVPADDLRALHGQVSQTMFAQGQRQFARVAGLSSTLPGPVAARLAEKFLPPQLAARVAELLDPGKARDLVGRVSLPYLADLALALDPVRARPVIRAIPAARLGEVAGELFRRGEHAIFAEFVGAVDVAALEAALDVARPSDLVAVLPLLEWGPALDQVLERLAPARVREIVAGISAEDLAGLAVSMDVAPLRPILGAIDAVVVADVARVLFAAGDHAAMAELARGIDPAMLLVALEVASDDDLARVVPLIAWEGELAAGLADLPPDQRTAVVRRLEGLPASATAGLPEVLRPS